jgi:hypothetical protein
VLESLTLSASQRSTLDRAAATYAADVHLAAEFLAARGITEAAARSSLLGVVSEPVTYEHKRFRGRLSIPFVTPAGVVQMRFRCLEDHDCRDEGHGKYDSPGGLPTRLYNVAALHSDGNTVGITEGELDAVVATHVLGLPSVGVPGIKNWKPHFARCFADYEEVLVFADHDEDEEKGLKHARRAVKEIPGARLVLPPLGLDLTEWVVRDGAEAVRDAVGM